MYLYKKYLNKPNMGEIHPGIIAFQQIIPTPVQPSNTSLNQNKKQDKNITTQRATRQQTAPSLGPGGPSR
jgi:hypothetical protein